MAGLRKAKKYDWKDTNLALFGSDLEKNVKKESASMEVAWKGAGQKPGLQVWRIVQFKVTSWPKEDHGKFYSGDSYIILNTYKEEGGDQLLYDVHFWIGRESSQDEYGTAAYKTVELDTFLNDVPVQHREVQGFESDLFKSYFKTITVMKGGAQTGFRHVEPEKYKPRLLHFCGQRRQVEIKEVPLSKDRIKSDDVFILDLGKTIYQWNGSGSNKDERFKAGQFCQQLESERCGRAKADVLEEGSTDPSHEFFQALTDDDEDDSNDEFNAQDGQQELFRLSDASGRMTFTVQKKGSVSKSDFDTSDVFILDAKKSLYVWVGKGTSKAEKRNAMQYAHEYLMKTDHPLISVSCMQEGRESRDFVSALAA
ncbi:gelsolin-like protein 2 [Aplysia californica]|uniref:Gelsolin-like protein 2 n=1 Tax=Aplysia californica TaxID=6500 RepID=A0ABM0JSB4_APLCA|nr:gelsolin-like protein 2 [Aplysia californica]XP_005100381.1 gelsolin-like protein 2 [Aplysia californica]XP_005100382.1 gelsolin-like protein 2 [Aplysia californica]